MAFSPAWTTPPAPPTGVSSATSPSSRMSAFRDSLSLLLKARFPVLYVESFEESRVVTEIAAVCADAERVRTPRPVHVWSATRGLVTADGKVEAGSQDPGRALEALLRREDPGMFVFHDLHAHLGDGAGRPADPGIVRRIRDVAAAFQTGASARTLVLVSPLLRIPPELEKDITILDFPLPGEQEIRALLDDMIATNDWPNRSQGHQRLWR